MGFIELINITKSICKKRPWILIPKNKKILIEYDSQIYGIEILNNQFNIFIGKDNILELMLLKDAIEESNDLYRLEKLQRFNISMLEYISITYYYPISISDDMKKIYEKTNIELSKDKRFPEINYKKRGMDIRIIKEKEIIEIEKCLKIFLIILENNLINKESTKIDLYQIDKNIIIKSFDKFHSILLINDFMKQQNKSGYIISQKKVIKNTLLLDMRFIKSSLVISAYNDTKEKLLIPFILNKLDELELVKYIKQLFKKGIYEKLIVYNYTLYKIINSINIKSKIIIEYDEISDIFDCVYDDYELILLKNS